MNFINIDFPAPKEQVLAILSDNETVYKNVHFEEGRGKPHMKIKDKGNGRIRITCEMLGRATRDNGFLVGTYFSGRLTEKNGVTKLRGIILTAPIYHTVLAALMVLFILKCIEIKGISVVPIILIIFDLFMFKDEFKKQGYIKRYLYRAAKRLGENQK